MAQGLSSSKAFNLVLIRHGQTGHNKLKIIQGQMETELTELGRDQARFLGTYLQKEGRKFDRIYCSDLVRAFDTCRIIFKDREDITCSKLIRERSFGVLQGLPLDRMRQEAAKAGYDDSNYTTFRPEGGETIDELNKRIVEFCKKELFPKADTDSTVAVVTHGGVIREFMKYFKREGCQLQLKDLYITPNTALNSFEIQLDSENNISSISINHIHHIPHLSDETRHEALHEEQLNESAHGAKSEAL